MSEYCSLFRGEESCLWNDVSLGSPPYQMEFDSAGSYHSSLSPTDTVSGSFWDQESLVADSEACYDTANTYSLLQTPDCKVLGEEFFEFLDEVKGLDNYLHSDSSNSCDGLEGVETFDFCDILSKPICTDAIDCELKFDFTQKSVAFTPKEEPSSPINDTVELDANIVYDITNTNERTVVADESYMSKLRKDHFKRKRDSSDSDKYTPALIVKLSPRSENSSSPSFVPKQSRRVSEGVVESSRSTYTAASLKKAAVVRNNTKNLSTKASNNVHSRVSGSDDDTDDDSQNDPSYNRASRVVRKSKKTRACNITLEENKNAVQARINREKKKAYIADLEQKVADLESENTSLKKETKSARSNTGALVEEVAYLKAVLANQSALAQLLKNINGDATMPVLTNPSSSQVNLSSSAKRRRLTEDHDYGQSTISKNSATRSASTKAAGVCLHVNKEHISLEMCRHCSQSSDARMK